MVKLRIKNHTDFFPEVTYECHKCEAITQFYTIPPEECIICGLKLPDLVGLMEEKDVRQNYHAKEETMI